jgi:hypothetical protein
MRRARRCRPTSTTRRARPPSTTGGSVAALSPRRWTGSGNTDLVVHGWDLARATGQDEQLDPAEVRRVLEATAGMGALIRGGGAFGPPVEVPEDADEQTRMLAHLGPRVKLDPQPGRPGVTHPRQPLAQPVGDQRQVAPKHSTGPPRLAGRVRRRGMPALRTPPPPPRPRTARCPTRPAG